MAVTPDFSFTLQKVRLQAEALSRPDTGCDGECDLVAFSVQTQVSGSDPQPTAKALGLVELHPSFLTFCPWHVQALLRAAALTGWSDFSF